MCTHINMLFAVTVNISSEAPCNDFKYLILVYIKKNRYTKLLILTLKSLSLDWIILHLFVQKNFEKANEHFEQLLTKYPNSPRALYGKARSLDKLAEKQRSNKMLEEAIATFQKVMDAKDSPDELFKQAGLMLGEKLEFRGNK